MHTLRFLVLALAAAACTSGSDAPRPDATTPSTPVSATSPEPGKVWFDGTFEEALAQARATEKLVFIDFWTTWCGWCKVLDKKTFSQPAVQAELARMVSLSIDAESPTGAPLKAKYHVSGYPALLVLDGNGKEVGRIAGFLEPEPFLKKLAEIRARVGR
jgi:thioredoxin 1